MIAIVKNNFIVLVCVLGGFVGCTTNDGQPETVYERYLGEKPPKSVSAIKSDIHTYGDDVYRISFTTSDSTYIRTLTSQLGLVQVPNDVASSDPRVGLIGPAPEWWWTRKYSIFPISDDSFRRLITLYKSGQVIVYERAVEGEYAIRLWYFVEDNRVYYEYIEV